MVIFQNGNQTVKFLGDKIFLVYNELPTLRNVQTHAHYMLTGDTII